MAAQQPPRLRPLSIPVERRAAVRSLDDRNAWFWGSVSIDGGPNKITSNALAVGRMRLLGHRFLVGWDYLGRDSKPVKRVTSVASLADFFYFIMSREPAERWAYATSVPDDGATYGLLEIDFEPRDEAHAAAWKAAEGVDAATVTPGVLLAAVLRRWNGFASRRGYPPLDCNKVAVTPAHKYNADGALTKISFHVVLLQYYLAKRF